MERARDRTLDQLLDLDGETFFIDRDGEYRVNFPSSAFLLRRRSHTGSSLTLHGPDNKRIIGFDNAHPAPPGIWVSPFDHVHKHNKTRPYRYHNAAALLQAFWQEVDKILLQRGIMT